MSQVAPTTRPGVFSHGIFKVKVIRKGDSYGLDDVLSWAHDEPGISFYVSCTKDGKPISGENGLGYFVSRYFYTTMLECVDRRRGVCLEGSEPVWLSVDALALECIMESVSRYVMAFATVADVRKWRENHSF